jgi:serine protease Do
MRINLASKKTHRTVALVLLATTALGTAGFLPARAQAALSPAAAATHMQGFADLVEQVGPAVVRISMMEAAPNLPNEYRGTPLERLAPNKRGQRADQQAQRVMGQGSGFVIDPSGYIVTNFHVAGKATQIMVTLPDGTELPAKLVGGDERTDLALLKVEAPKPLPAVAFESGSPPRVGDVVVAVGNPFGLSATVTAGIISARGRDLGAGPYDDFLQTDAAINPGNSGGPLFDTDGRVVGVNTAIVSPSGGSVGIGFAIPAELASKVVTELREHGEVKRGWLGVELGPNEHDNHAGAQIVAVQRESPAARAGLKPGDIILEADGGAVTDGRYLARHVADHAPGSALKLAIKRDAVTLDMQVTLGDLPRAS